MTQMPDTKPGNYYVSVRRDDGDFRCLIGPFRDDHAAALAVVDVARRIAEKADPKAVFYSFGTLRTEYSYDEPGILQKRGLYPEPAEPAPAPVKRRTMRYAITSTRKDGRQRVEKFETLEAANKVAQAIFAATGIVVGIEAINRRAA
jgi:hypothetical protein